MQMPNKTANRHISLSKYALAQGVYAGKIIQTNLTHKWHVMRTFYGVIL